MGKLQSTKKDPGRNAGKKGGGQTTTTRKKVGEKTDQLGVTRGEKGVAVFWKKKKMGPWKEIGRESRGG